MNFCGFLCTPDLSSWFLESPLAVSRVTPLHTSRGCWTRRMRPPRPCASKRTSPQKMTWSHVLLGFSCWSWPKPVCPTCFVQRGPSSEQQSWPIDQDRRTKSSSQSWRQCLWGSSFQHQPFPRQLLFRNGCSNLKNNCQFSWLFKWQYLDAADMFKRICFYSSRQPNVVHCCCNFIFFQLLFSPHPPPQVESEVAIIEILFLVLALN